MNPIFKITVKSIAEIAKGYCHGLHALGEKSSYIKPENPRKIEGSVDIDSCLRDLYPEEPRWDYIIGYQSKVYFLEIHHGATSEVNTVIAKVEWLEKWLELKASELMRIDKNRYRYWVPTNGYKILPNSPYQKKLAQKKIKVIKQLNLPPQR